MDWRQVLWHEFVHVITLQKTGNRLPRWLSEGISVYEETRRDSAWGQRLDDSFAAVIAQGDGIFEDSVTGRAGKREVGSHLAHGQKTVFLSTGVDRAAHHERSREKRDTDRFAHVVHPVDGSEGHITVNLGADPITG